MSEATKNKISAKIIKAEMLGDDAEVKRLKHELQQISRGSSSRQESIRPKSPVDSLRSNRPEPSMNVIYNSSKGSNNPSRSGQNDKVRKLIGSIGTLDQMFHREKTVTASDEAKMFIKTALKLSKDDMETKHFSEEIDDSQVILNRKKKHKAESDHIRPGQVKPEELACSSCLNKLPRHLVVDNTGSVYLSLLNSKPFLSHMSNVVISNIEHDASSFVSASGKQQDDILSLLKALKSMWKTKGYRCIIMETHFRKKRLNDLTSGGNHFQLHCLPIKEKHFERSRMSFKQALQECEGEWSLNKKLLTASDGKKIQRYLPRGLPYFWVCFDELTNGFGHVIENEDNFSRYFGLEVLSGLLDKDFNPMKMCHQEAYKEQFERSRDFKLLYANFKE